MRDELLVTPMRKGGKHTAEMRALIAERTRAALAGPIVRARMSYMAKRSWTPERRAAQRLKFLKLKEMAVNHDFGTEDFETRRLRKLKESQQSDSLRLKLRVHLTKARMAPAHPLPILPPMSKAEKNRYRYLRPFAGRNTALAVIMADRRGGRGG